MEMSKYRAAPLTGEKMKMPRMPEAKLPLPKFANEEEEVRYWETHSAAEVWDKLPRVKSVKLIRSEKAKRIAARKSIAYQTQLRLWIAEGIRREGKRQ
jgi:hypothetical protein